MQAMTRRLLASLPDFSGDPLHGPDADAMQPRELHNARPSGPQVLTDCRFLRRIDGGAAKGPALRLRSLQARLDAALDHRPFKLCEHAHHLEEGLPGWRCSVHPLLMEKEVNAKRVKLGKERHKVLEAPPEPVNGPRHDDIKATPRRVSAQSVECGAILA
jgi:hypothetical protein